MKLPSIRLNALRFLLPCGALLCALLGPLPAFAGAVYKCDGPGGQIAFTNKPGNYSHCKKVAEYADSPAAPAKAAATAGPHTDYHSETVADNAAATAAETSPAPADGGAGPAASVAPGDKAAADKSAEVRRGAVYKVAKANGITEYTNIRPSGSAYQVLFTYMATCFACNVHSNIDWLSTPLHVDAFRDEIAAAALQFAVDPALLRAVIHAESAFNPNAVSIKGAQGLMQLMPGTASDLGVDNAFDASQNIRGGAQYLAGLLKQFNGNERMATAAYDAGPQNVQKYNGVPPFDETQVYVDRVAKLRQRYHEAAE